MTGYVPPSLADLSSPGPTRLQLTLAAPGYRISTDTLSSLSRLRYLDLSLLGNPPQQLRPLTALSNLHHLSLDARQLSFLDVEPLFSLTGLTHLQLSTLLDEQAKSGGDAPAAAAAHTPVDLDEVSKAAIARLGGLSQLQHVSLGFCFVVYENTYAALLQLRQLSSLSVARIDLPPEAPWQMLPLQRLMHSGTLLPSQLLQMLRQLPHLESWNDGFVEQDLSPNISLDGDSGHSIQSAALPALATYFCARPSPLQTLTLNGMGRPVHLPFSQLLQSLQPCLHHVRRLDLHGVSPAESDWVALTAGLPALAALDVRQSLVSDAALATLGCRDSIINLNLRGCTGPSRDRWLALAAARTVKLFVKASPRVELEIVQACDTLQLRLRGHTLITFQEGLDFDALFSGA